MSLPRTDWVYLVTGSTGSFGLGRAVALGLGALVGVFLCLACLRMAEPPSLADSCRIMLAGCCLGLVVVYHHHYDLATLIPPLLLAVLLRDQLGLSWSRWVTWSFAPLTFIVLFVPVQRARSIVEAVVGDRGHVLVHVSFPIATTLALAGSLAMVLDATGSLAGWRDWVATWGRARRGTRRAETSPTA